MNDQKCISVGKFGDELKDPNVIENEEMKMQNEIRGSANKASSSFRNSHQQPNFLGYEAAGSSHHKSAKFLF